MKSIICLLSILVLSLPAFAEVYILIDTATEEVRSISPENDAQAEEGQEIIIIPGEVNDYPLQHRPQLYKYQNNRLVVNVEKVSNEELARQASIERKEEQALVDESLVDIAVKELEKTGKIFKHLRKKEE